MVLLRSVPVQLVFDVRTVPRSRYNPQFNQTNLQRELPRAGIRYHPAPRLGGLRRPRKDSTNDGWRNASFRGFADYMETPEFDQGLSELVAASTGQATAILCAEAVPWRCHRSLIADALLIRSIEVVHLLSTGKLQPHRLTPFATVVGDRLRYPRPPPSAVRLEDYSEAAEASRRHDPPAAPP